MSKITEELLKERILAALNQSEEKGDLVITTNIPGAIANTIIHTLADICFKEQEATLALIECSIPDLLEQTAGYVVKKFAVDEARAKEIVNTFYHRLLKRLTMRQTAELISHEAPQEIALLSYYCVELKNCDGRTDGYLDWRKKYY
jgi:hypothetical protein